MSDKTLLFIQKARNIHGDLYDYSRVNYTGSQVKVLIIDPEHGEFWQTPNKHLSGRGCPARYAASLRMTTEEFIRRATEVHGELYDYSRTTYTGAHDKVCIIDPEYGEFYQTAHHHLDGRGHPKRGIASAREKNTKPLERFIEDAIETHGTIYDYSRVDYVNAKTKVCIVDPEFGEFWQTPAAHLSGAGNPERGARDSGISRRLTNHEFVNRARAVHGDLYNYSEIGYTKASEHVDIIDPIHGKFRQLASNHLEGKGNPRRSTRVSKPHQAILEFLDSLGVEYEINNRDVLDGYEVDVLVGDLAIEVDGVYWHRHEKIGDRYHHQNKHRLANDAGISLMQFFDTDIIERLPIVKSMIQSRLHLSPIRVPARKTEVVTISSSDYRNFLDNNHLQGAVNSGIRIGLSFEGDIVSVMGLSNRRGGLTLDRFVSKLGHQVVGGFTKLFSRVNDSPIRTHSANRYATGGVYQANGFVLEKEHPYTLYYVQGGKLFSRERFQKHKLHAIYPEYNGEPVEEFLAERGVFSLYAAGTKTWLFTPR